MEFIWLFCQNLFLVINVSHVLLTPSESEEETEEPEERQQTPEAVADDSAAYYEQSVR